jgi:hypothetical protein
MSDLAPFVAAVFRDKVIKKLLKERKVLSRLQTRQVQIMPFETDNTYASTNLIE